MSMILFNNYDVKVMTLGKYMKMKNQHGVVTDPAFQANSGYKKDGKDGRWGKQNDILYMSNLIRGHAPSAFVFANMNKCLDAAIERGDRQKDIAYFKRWLLSGTYMNIDSYNRNVVLGDADIDGEEAISGFFNDEIPILSNDYQLKSEKVVHIDDSNNVWSKMPKALQEHILNNIKITLFVYNNATQENLSEICRAVNEGVVFTPAIYRNTFTTNIAEECRNIAMGEVPFFDNAGCDWFSPDQKIKRDVDATIARMFFMTKHSFAQKVASDKELLKMYKVDMDSKDLKKGINLIKDFIKYLKDSKDIMAQGNTIWYGCETKVVVLFHLFDYFLDIRKVGFIVDDTKYTDVFNKFMSVYTKELKSAKSYPGVKGKTVQFKTIKNGTQLYNVKHFKDIFEDQFDLMDYCIKKPKRNYNADEKTILAVEQDWVTPEGKDIPRSELHDSKKFETGHQKAFCRSKDSSLENGAVQTKDDNRDLQGNDIPSNV